MVARPKQMESFLERTQHTGDTRDTESTGIVGCFFFTFLLPETDVGPFVLTRMFLFSVSSVRTLEEAKVTRGCLYMQMPVQEVSERLSSSARRYDVFTVRQYGTLQFSKYDEIEKKGYGAAVEILDRWEEEGKLPSLTIDGPNAEKSKAARKGRSARRNSV